MADVVKGYAQALLTMAAAEGQSEEFESELSQVAQAIGGSEELRSTLADTSIPVVKRQQIVEDVLGGQSSRLTSAAVSMIVGAGRAADLSAIASQVMQIGANQRGHVLAEVRSAVPLSDDQKSRLTNALNRSTGKDVEVSVVVDETVLGGLVTKIDDQVIDGSVRSRLGQLREAF